MTNSRATVFGPRGWGLASAQMQLLTPAHPAYNARVDRLDAIRLLQALVAAGADSRTPMASAWVHKIAIRDMSLQGTELASAIAYAEGEGWLADIPTRKDCISLTRAGEVIAKQK